MTPSPSPSEARRAALAALLASLQRSGQELPDGEQRDTRERVRRLLAAPEFAYPSEPGREAYPTQALAWCRRLAAEGIGPLGLPREHGGGGDPAAFLAAFDLIPHHGLDTSPYLH